MRPLSWDGKKQFKIGAGGGGARSWDSLTPRPPVTAGEENHTEKLGSVAVHSPLVHGPPTRPGRGLPNSWTSKHPSLSPKELGAELGAHRLRMVSRPGPKENGISA